MTNIVEEENKSSIDEWYSWANENIIHPALYLFVRSNNEYAFDLNGEKVRRNMRRFRIASLILYITGNAKSIERVLGEEFSNKFIEFCSQMVLTAQEALKGNYEEGYIKSMSPSLRNASIMGLIFDTNKDNINDVREFVKREYGEDDLNVYDILWSQGEPERKELLEKIKENETQKTV